jgi:ABC-type transport system involved in multi-copper enzyme maturation permease subunit
VDDLRNNFTRSVVTSTRHAVLSWKFAAAALAFCALLFLAGFDTILAAVTENDPLWQGFHGQLIYNALSSDVILFAMPILCVLPYGAAYIEDIKTGYIKLYLVRTTRKNYIAGKFAGCFLSGGLVSVVGTLCAYGISTLIFSHLEEADDFGTSWLLELLPLLLRFFLSGGFWAFLGMLLSTQMESKYVAYASPFLFYYLLVILQERYFSSLYVLNPEGWLLVGGEWVLGSWSAVAVVVMLTILAFLLFSQSVKRRIELL